MTANSGGVFWAPLADEKVVPLNDPLEFIHKMKLVFGSSPYELGQSDLPKLTTLAALEQHSVNPYAVLVEALRRHGKIRVWVGEID